MLPVTDQLLQPELLRAIEKAGYILDDDNGQRTTSSRPGRLTLKLRTRGGTPVIGKVYSDGKGARVFQTMLQLWQSSFGRERTPAGLAEPRDYISDGDVIISEWVPGRPLIELGTSKSAHIKESMRLLADLHICGVVPETRRSWRGILRSLDRKMQTVAKLAPQFVSHVQPVVEALRRTRVKDTEFVCAHGDFSARNVLVGDTRCVLMDWDRLQQADPARDVAYFAVWPWREAIRRGRLPDRRSLDEAVEAYEIVRPAAKLGKQLPFHVAAGLVRMCCSLITLWPEQSYLVPGLARVAINELERQK